MWLLIAFIPLSAILTWKRQQWFEKISYFGAKQPFEAVVSKEIDKIDCKPSTTEANCPGDKPVLPSALEASGKALPLNWPYKPSRNHLPSSSSTVCRVSEKGCWFKTPALFMADWGGWKADQRWDTSLVTVSCFLLTRSGVVKEVSPSVKEWHSPTL